MVCCYNCFISRELVYRLHCFHSYSFASWSAVVMVVRLKLFSLATFIIFSRFLSVMIPEYPKCYLNASETIRMSIFTTCGPDYIEFCHLTCGSHSRHLGFKGKGKVYLSTRSSHHPKTVASFQLTRLALIGMSVQIQVQVLVPETLTS